MAGSILITGGAGGIGLACARAFLADGAAVHLVDIDGERLAQARTALDPLGVVSTHRSSLATPLECRAAFASFGRPADVLVHMAGVFEHDPLDADDRQVWERAIGSNLTNAYEMAIAFRAQHDAATVGRIVLCSSRAFQRGAPGRAAYTAAKGGIVGLMRTFSREFAPQILVNAIAPGLIDTPMTAALIESAGAQRLSEIPLRRFGKPEDIAGVVRFLCGPDSSYVTGQLITVDGGTLNSS
ncbi:3-oxoacyl-[acyl-carrier-protein] reductase FabG [Variovorax sp. PBL-H6]|uniref:SDR family NAD(P)-dependent oxidoreductase n=1 Tax=Variovorax sp. PBL-H6 TaxID=434009 RepID=UPI0013160A4C|nr:SDR family NAD(P)-dependent oxidoreductase [Variovorax sp. PBL-H6]VTU31806.1 3-oxoacyl-[acyl-carrier-protein] reductase FabG [Variovorax sp. PBL-H6]